MYSTLLALVILGAAVCLWRDSLRAREIASRVARRACDSEDVQFLDDTVALAGLRPVMEHGRPLLRRVYQFEFSRRGNDRHDGSVMLTGARVDTVFLAPAPPSGEVDGAGGTVVSLDEARRRH